VITVDDLRAVVWGLGAMGGGIARVLTEREGVRVVGAIDSNPELVGKDLGQVLGLESNYGVEVVAEPGKVLSNSRAQVCIVATSSFVEDVQEQLVAAIKAGCNVISIAEEMADPAASHLETAAMLDRLARQHGVTVLGTGINPGFVLDSLIIVLTAACTNVERIRARRINDLGPFGPTVMRTQGVGTTPEQFEQGLADGTIVGHVGFAESLGLISTALGWHLDEIRQERTPIVAGEERKGDYIRVPAGRVAGCRHTARGYIEGREVITLEHPQQVDPAAAGVETGDFIDIEGVPRISMAIQPEIPGGTGTIALAANMTAPVVAASPGLKTMADLPLPRALLGNVHCIVEQLRRRR